MSQRLRTLSFVVALAASAVALPALAQQGRGQPGQGPVALHCNDDIATLCLGTQHGDRSARACLERNRAKLSPACTKALNETGGGRGRGQGRGQQG